MIEKVLGPSVKLHINSQAVLSMMCVLTMRVRAFVDFMCFCMSKYFK